MRMARIRFVCPSCSYFSRMKLSLRRNDQILATGPDTASRAPRSTDLHTASPLPAPPPAIAGRTRIPCRCMFPCRYCARSRPALLRVLAGIVAAQQRLEMLIPFVHEVEAALLHPAVKIASRNLIRIMKHSIFRRQNFHRSLLHRNPRPAEFRRVGSEVSGC